MGYIGRFEDKQKQTSSTSTITFKSQQVQRNQQVVVKFASVADYTTANKKLILGIRDNGSVDHYLQVNKPLATYRAEYSLELKGEITLIEGEQLIGIVESPTASDALYFSVFGDRYKIKEI